MLAYSVGRWLPDPPRELTEQERAMYARMCAQMQNAHPPIFAQMQNAR
jgi:hypothetical protein